MRRPSNVKEATELTKPMQCLLQDMVEYSALIDLYRSKLQSIKSQLKGKEVVIEELKAIVEQNNVNRAVPELAIKVAALMENPDKDCLVLASLLKNLIQNRVGMTKLNPFSLQFLTMEAQPWPKL